MFILCRWGFFRVARDSVHPFHQEIWGWSKWGQSELQCPTQPICPRQVGVKVFIVVLFRQPVVVSSLPPPSETEWVKIFLKAGSFFNITWEGGRGQVLRDVEFFPWVLSFSLEFLGKYFFPQKILKFWQYHCKFSKKNSDFENIY